MEGGSGLQTKKKGSTSHKRGLARREEQNRECERLPANVCWSCDLRPWSSGALHGFYSAKVLKAVAVAAVEAPPSPNPPTSRRPTGWPRALGHVRQQLLLALAEQHQAGGGQRSKVISLTGQTGVHSALADSHQTELWFVCLYSQTNSPSSGPKIAQQRLFLLLSAACEAIKWQQTRIWTSVWLAQGEVCRQQ